MGGTAAADRDECAPLLPAHGPTLKIYQGGCIRGAYRASAAIHGWGGMSRVRESENG